MNFTLPLPNSVTPDDPVCLISSSNILNYYNNNNLENKDAVDDEVKKYVVHAAKLLGWDSIKWTGQQCILTNHFKIKDSSDILSFTKDNKLKINIDNNALYFNLYYDYDINSILALQPYFNTALINNILNIDRIFDKVQNNYCFNTLHINKGFLYKRKNKIYVNANLIDNGVLAFQANIHLTYCVYNIDYDFIKNTIVIGSSFIKFDDIKILDISESEIECIFSSEIITEKPTLLDDIVSDEDKMDDLIKKLLISHKNSVNKLGKLIIDRLRELDSSELIDIFIKYYN